MPGRWSASLSPSGCWRTFSTGRPPLEDVGVQVVADVGYELMKLRLLDGAIRPSVTSVISPGIGSC